MTATKNSVYKLETIDSSKILTAISQYQRQTDSTRANDIAAHFDERIANEPKVSFRDGRYFVFDGQHTILARIKLNGGKHLPVLCKVYYDLSAEDEAFLFAAQTGLSSKLTSGEKLRAKAFSNDRTALDFIEANSKAGIDVSLSNSVGRYRLRCVSTAFDEFQRLGYKKYIKAMRIICEAWEGNPDSFHVPVIIGICRFVNLYDGCYNHEKIVCALCNVDPKTFVEEAEKDSSLVGVNRYLNYIFSLYNCIAKNKMLAKKF